MALRNNWIDKVDGIDYVKAEDINDIAQAVIDLEMGGDDVITVLSDNLFDKTAIVGEGVFSYDYNGYEIAQAASYYAFVPHRGIGTYRTKFNWVQHDWSDGRIALTDDNNNWVCNSVGVVTPTDNNAAYDFEFEITQEMVNKGATKIAFDCYQPLLNSVMIVKDREYPDKYIPYGYIEVLTEDAKKVPNILTEKTAVFLGDSICAASTEYEGAMAGYGWAGLIGEANNMVWKNCGVDGGTITELEEVAESIGERAWLTKQVDVAYAEHPDADYVIFEGGCNDAARMGDSKLGEISTGYSNFDKTTFSGAFETLVLKMINTFPKAKIGYIIPPKMHTGNDHTSKGHEYRRFFDRAVEICQKWGIPVIDLWNGCPMNPKLTVYYDSSIPKLESNAAGKYYTDGQHLTITGYKFISPLIEAWMRNLYTNGDISGGASEGSAKNSIHYVEGRSVTAGTWLGTSDEITEYYDGLTIAYKTNVIGASGGTTLNINGLGAVSVVRNNNTLVYNQYVTGSILILTYTTDANGTAYWKIADYDDDKKTSSGKKDNTKLFLTGATSQTTSGTTTYTNSNCYIGADNCLYSNGEKVATGSGASVQSDLTQNDETAPDYVKGRTHWVESEVVLPETYSEDAEDGIVWFETPETFKDGENYIVTINGTTYKSKGVTVEGTIYIGNPVLAGDESFPNTGEPFLIFGDGEWVGIVTAEGLTSATLSISTETVHQIDPKFVPNLPYSETVKTILPETTYTLNNGLYQEPATLELELGKYYTVVYDGVEYTTFPFLFTYQGAFATGLGNAKLLEPSLPYDTGESFIFAYISSFGAFGVGASPATGTHTIAIYEKNIHTLPMEYLSMRPFIVEAEVNTAFTEFTKINKMFSEIEAAHESGREVVFRVKQSIAGTGDMIYIYRVYSEGRTSEGVLTDIALSNSVAAKRIAVRPLDMAVRLID